MTVRVVTPPATPVADLADVKVHLEVEHDDHDARLTSLIAAATGALEAATQRRFITQVLEWVIPAWRYPMRLPVAGALSSGLTVTYADEVLGAMLLPSGDYVVRPSGQTLVVLASDGAVFPVLDPDASERVIIRFSAGQAAAPAEAVEACKLLVEYYYEARDWLLATSGLPIVVESLIAPLRWD